MTDKESVAGDGPGVVRRLIEAASQYDIEACDRLLREAVSSFAPLELVRDIVAPVMRETGNRWHQGEFSVVQEHLLTGLVRRRLSDVLDEHTRGSTGPAILFTTLSGERHEIGVLMAAVIAAADGFRCYYLGPDLRAADICEFCARRPVVALALSHVTQPEVVDVVDQLRELRAGLPASTEIWVGGQAALRLARSELPEGVIPIADLATFGQRLAALHHSGESRS